MSRTDSTWRDKSWRRQALMHSKRKIPDSRRTGWKAKACTSFALYLKVFKNHLYYLWQVRVLSIKPCLHTQLPEHNASINSSGAHAPSPGANPQTVAFFQKMGKFPGVGTHKLSKCPGVGTKKEGKFPAPGICCLPTLLQILLISE